MSIGGTIRVVRLERGLSQRILVEKTGLQRPYISRVENGHTVPSWETLQRIAAGLGIPLSKLVARYEQQEHVQG